MAVKSIIDVEVNDGSFQAFAKVYQRYQNQLRTAPAAWAAVGKQIDGTRKNFQLLVNNMVAQNAQAKLYAVAQERADRATRTMADRWRDMARSTKDTAANITRATAALLKWTALTTVFSGLLGAGGLFGIDRLANTVGAGRRSSLGLGTSYGEQKAFGVNYGRFVDPDSFLAAVNEALTDVTKRVGLYGAGLTENQIAGRSTAEVASSMIPLLKRIADQTPDAQLAQVLKARNLDQFIGVQDLMRLKRTDAREISGIRGAYGENKRQFDLDAEIQERWQNLSTQLSRAAQGIENTFVKGLAPLTPKIERLSASFERLVERALKSETIERLVSAIEMGLEKIGNWLDLSPTAGGRAAVSPAEALRRNQTGLFGHEPETAGQAKFNAWMTYLLGQGAAPTGAPPSPAKLPAELRGGGGAAAPAPLPGSAFGGLPGWAKGERPMGWEIINKSNADVTVTVTSPPGSNTINTGTQVAQ